MQYQPMPPPRMLATQTQERYASLERDFEVELLLKADAAEAGGGSAAAGPASAPGSPGAAPQLLAGQCWHQGEARADARTSRLGRPGQAGEGSGTAGGSPRRPKAPAATSEPAEHIVSNHLQN